MSSSMSRSSSDRACISSTCISYRLLKVFPRPGSRQASVVILLLPLRAPSSRPRHRRRQHRLSAACCLRAPDRLGAVIAAFLVPADLLLRIQAFEHEVDRRDASAGGASRPRSRPARQARQLDQSLDASGVLHNSRRRRIRQAQRAAEIEPLDDRLSCRRRQNSASNTLATRRERDRARPGRRP